MNQDRWYGICIQLRGVMKQQWGRIADDPLAVNAGMRDRLSGMIQERRGISKYQSDLQLEDFMSRNRNWWDLARRQRAP